MGTFQGGFPALAIQQPNIGNQIAQAMEIKARQQQIAGQQQAQELGAVQLQQARIDANSRATLMKLWSDNDGDMNQTVADAKASGVVTPEHLQAFQQGSIAVQTAAAKLTADQLANHKAINDLAADKLDAVKQLPLMQRPQAILDAYGELLHAGADPNELEPHIRALASNPTDDNIGIYETSIKGRTWAADQQLKELELASKPTAQQAQALTQANLDKAATEAIAAHRELDNMPTALEAHTARAQSLLEQASQTAKNNAEAANARLDAKMKGVKLVYAVDSTGQMNLLPMQAANQAGMKVYAEAPGDAYANEKKSAIEIGAVQSGISEYRAAANSPDLHPDTEQDKAMQGIMSDKKVLGDLADHVPLGARLNDMVTGLQNANHWNELDPAHQKLVAAYFTAKIGAMNMQKLQGGSIGRNQEVIHAEFAAVPSPSQANSPSFNEQVDQFQKRLNVAAQGAVRVPGVRTPQEIRADIEQREAQDQQNRLRANEVFRGAGGINNAPSNLSVPPAQIVPGFRPPISTGGNQ